MLARLEDSVLVVIDVQPPFLDPVCEKDRVLERTTLIVECAKALGVPILATEQVPDRMGGTEGGLGKALAAGSVVPLGKSAFSCGGSSEFIDALGQLDRGQVVLTGIETHICVNQTAHDLMDQEFDVIVCADAVGARKEDMHEIGLRRMADEGAAIAHTESVVYEWMRTADHPAFREVLKLVKAAAG